MRSFLNPLPYGWYRHAFNVFPPNIHTGKHNEQEEPKHRHEYDDGKRSHKQNQQINNSPNHFFTTAS
jgi:hypothetical protein